MMSKSRASPRKFSEKIALLNRNESVGNAEFAKIIKDVKETRAAAIRPLYSGKATGRYSSRRSHLRANRTKQLGQIPFNIADKPIDYNNNDNNNRLCNSSLATETHQYDCLPQATVPDICVFSIDDYESAAAANITTQQQVTTTSTMANTAAYLSYSHGAITSASSLPDISTLSFSSNISPACSSDQQLTSKEMYHVSRNFSTNSNPQEISTSYDNTNQHYHNSQQQQQQYANRSETQWNLSEANQLDNDAKYYHQSQYDLQSSTSHGNIRQNYVQQEPQQQPRLHQHNPLVRARSSNAVYNGGDEWPNSYTLQAPKIINHLTKSASNNYLGSYLTDNDPSNSYRDSVPPNPQHISYPILRSNSYGHIGDFNFSNHIKTHQPSVETSNCNCYECCYKYYPSS